jgi:hypothetical protein
MGMMKGSVFGDFDVGVGVGVGVDYLIQHFWRMYCNGFFVRVQGNYSPCSTWWLWSKSISLLHRVPKN